MSIAKHTEFGTMGREALRKLRNDNNINIIITAQNSQTGLGKTTLAAQLCRFIDNNWTAEDKAFIEVRKYLNAYLDVEPMSALLLDEIEHGADSRRANSHENVDLSQGWAKLRARNVATVATLPSTSMLDKRMLELADYQVIVKERGLAQPFKIRVNDFAPDRMPSRKPLPGDEHIRFGDLPNSDDDMQYLNDIKDDIIRTGGISTIPKKEHQEKKEKAVEQAQKETRDEFIRSLYNSTDMSYADIGNIPAVDLTKQTVGQIVREET